MSMTDSESEPPCSSAPSYQKLRSPVILQFVRSNTVRFCQCVALPHSGGNVPEKGVALGLSEPSCKVSSTGNEPLLPQQGGSVPVRGTSLKTRTDRFGNAPGCAHVLGTVPVNITQCIGTKFAPRLKFCCRLVQEMLWYASKKEQMLQTQDAQTCAARDTYASVQASQPAIKSCIQKNHPCRSCTPERIGMQLTKFIYKLQAALLAKRPISTYTHTCYVTPING